MSNLDARDLNLQISPESLKPLFKTNPFTHGLAIAFNWLIILATIFACFTYFNPLTYFVAILTIGARMHALAILMHDATHYPI